MERRRVGWENDEKKASMPIEGHPALQGSHMTSSHAHTSSKPFAWKEHISNSATKRRRRKRSRKRHSANDTAPQWKALPSPRPFRSYASILLHQTLLSSSSSSAGELGTSCCAPSSYPLTVAVDACTAGTVDTARALGILTLVTT
eukprot:scaffold8151_cov239-Pinguiococcus_pyrenoidosus.AAC.3